jgi:ubiquinone/menaquinone biosynthesis C-methylase UbiE
MKSVEKWIKTEGKLILREIGITEGQQILDFGCGSGIYTIIASKIVGNQGMIYALDSDEEGLLGDLIDKVKNQKIQNIKIIKTSGEISFPVNNETMDVILIFDIIHLLDKDEKIMLFKESNRVLKKNGFVSYHATHLGGGYDVNLKKFHSNMKKNGLILKQKYEKPMFHWAWIENSIIFNYVKNKFVKDTGLETSNLNN